MDSNLLKKSNKNESIERLQKKESFNFNRIESYYLNKEKSSNNSFHITDQTFQDLDLHEVFMKIDFTHSKIGQQYLYNQIRTLPLGKTNASEIQEEIIQLFQNSPERTKKVTKTLKTLNNYSAFHIHTLFQDKHIDQPKYYNFLFILPLIALASILLSFIYTKLFLITICVFLTNFIIHFLNKNNINQYVRSIPQLISLNQVAKKLANTEDFERLNPNIHKSIKKLNSISRKSILFNLEAKLQGELESIIWSAIELVKILFLMEPIAFFNLLDTLNDNKKEMENVFEFVGKIDTLLSIHLLRSKLKTYCIPKIHKNNNTIEMKDAYHPLITQCVKNNVKIQNKSILLTGSNMSGKTTFIRTIGINIILGLSLNTCFANQVEIPYTRIYTSICISDDLVHEKSYFLEEVNTVKSMLNNVTSEQHTLFLMDELFKGTNTIERIAAAKSILSYLANKNSHVIISTHDIELTHLLEKEYSLYHFSESIQDKKLHFDYKLKEGRLTKRNAINVLKLNDYPEEIISEAIMISKKLDKKSQLSNDS